MDTYELDVKTLEGAQYCRVILPDGISEQTARRQAKRIANDLGRRFQFRLNRIAAPVREDIDLFETSNIQL